jgi:uncharacterized membrane protein YeaQ/YmgE (transglycosylase-associated protein family)
MRKQAVRQYDGFYRAARAASFVLEASAERPIPARRGAARVIPKHGGPCYFEAAGSFPETIGAQPGSRQTLSRSNRMLAFIGTLIVGLVVGLIARAIKPGDDNMGWVMTILLGIAGSLIAGYVGRALGWYQPGQPAGWIASVIGAIILLVVWGMIRKRST